MSPENDFSRLKRALKPLKRDGNPESIYVNQPDYRLLKSVIISSPKGPVDPWLRCAAALPPSASRRFRDDSAPSMQERRRGLYTLPSWDIVASCVARHEGNDCRSSPLAPRPSPPEQERSEELKTAVGAGAPFS
ncbi:hypothetical protein N431DRAFT_453514 [Stipitochalara longipes BDJ]|nr:hypothetical protein N431DRAFT_453514 [Stipitochalara longipes BDJ]